MSSIDRATTETIQNHSGETVLSVIVPMFNESDSAQNTVQQLTEAFRDFRGNWEIIFVDDGSTDDSRERLKELTKTDSRFKIIGYKKHVGRGKALALGLKSAKGGVIISIDFDLTYSPHHIFRIFEYLQNNKEVDAVLGSCYSPGGEIRNVKPFRLFVSRAANIILSLAFRKKWRTVTCVLRGYRRKTVDLLRLTSKDKIIHLEILRQLMDNGLHVDEIPAVLEGRKTGVSKTGLVINTLRHLIYAAKINPAAFISVPLGIMALGFLLMGIIYKGDPAITYYYLAGWAGSIAALAYTWPLLRQKNYKTTPAFKLQTGGRHGKKNYKNENNKQQ